MLQRILSVLTASAMAVGVCGACATKKFVRTSVGEVNTKVDSLSRSVETTQEHTRENEARIGQVRRQTQSAAQSAQQATTVARQADAEAAQTRTTVSAASSEADRLEKASRRLVYDVVIDDTEGNFTFGKAHCRLRRCARSTTSSRN